MFLPEKRNLTQRTKNIFLMHREETPRKSAGVSSLGPMKRRRPTNYYTEDDFGSLAQDAAASPLEWSVSLSELDAAAAGDVPPTPARQLLSRPPPRRSLGDRLNFPPQPSSLSNDLRYSGIHDEHYFMAMYHPLVPTFRPLALCEIDNGFTLNRSPVPDRTDFQTLQHKKFNLTIFDDNLTVGMFLEELCDIGMLLAVPEDDFVIPLLPNLLNYDGTPLLGSSPLASFYKTITVDSVHYETVLFNFYIQRQLQRDDGFYSLRVTFTFPIVENYNQADVVNVLCTEIMTAIYGDRIRRTVRNGVIGNGVIEFGYPLQTRA